MTARILVAVGSSLGDREGHLATAAEGLRAVGGLRASRIYETAPVGGVAQRRFLNAAFEVRLLSPPPAPLALLEALQAVERAAGRTRTLRWEDRTLDLDLVLWGDRVMNAPRLRVPHPELHRRRFVLAPLCDLAPDARHPVLGVPLSALLEALDDDPEDVTPIAPERYPAAWPTPPT